MMDKGPPPYARRGGWGMKRDGFTLIELLIVMALIGLLATIAIPRLSNTKERAQLAAMKTDLRNLVTMEENFLAENQKYTIDLGTAYHVSPGNRAPAITLTNDGWTALITSSNTTQQCAVFVGSTPLAPATREGAPECAKGASSATPLP
jgi:prepilin-type N-terminal cleavage/methylation domain-containing protein